MNNTAAFYEGVKACENWWDNRLDEDEDLKDAMARLCPHDLASTEGNDWQDGFAAQFELCDVEEHVDTTELIYGEVDEATRTPASAFNDDEDTHL